MPSPNLDRLCGTGLLHAEPPAADEFTGLLRSGLARLNDARNAALAPESRFDLAYNVAHALCLAALRWQGYRPAPIDGIAKQRRRSAPGKGCSMRPRVRAA